MQTQKLCTFCKKPAEYNCGYCMEATYCTSQHQKADWPNHKKICIKITDKVKQLIKNLTTLKKQFYDAKCRKDSQRQCQSICQSMKIISKQILDKQPSPIHEIQYGIAVCCLVRQLYILKNFSQSNTILDNYIKQKSHFLKDTSHIPSKPQITDDNYNQLMHFAKCKLKLLATISSLNYMSRSSTESIQILLAHCEKLYGPNSLQVSNVYFEMGNYFHKLGENYKAIGCFLVAARMRGDNGVISYFNAAIILMTKKDIPQYQKTIQLLQKYCLKIINAKGDQKNIVYRVYLALAYCYRKLNHFDKTIQYLQKALCQVNLKHRFENQQHNTICQLLRILDEVYKKQFINDQITTLHREVPLQQHQIILSNANIQDFKQTYIDTTQKRKQEQWLKSFTNAVEKTKYESKIPMTNVFVQKHLFVNQFIDDKNQQNATASKEIAIEQVRIDQRYMTQLTAAQVKNLNQLNKMLSLNKEKQNIVNIVQNSNFKKQTTEEKLQRLYQLNPEFVKQRATYVIIDEQPNSRPTINNLSTPTNHFKNTPSNQLSSFNVSQNKQMGSPKKNKQAINKLKFAKKYS